MAKGLQTRFVCRNCGFESAKWLGKCPQCDEWGTLEETITLAPPKGMAAKSSSLALVGRSAPMRLTDVPSPEEEGRVQTGIGEFDRVLGGGIVRGALMLIGGEPGIGKCLAGDQRVLDPLTGDLLPITAWRDSPRPVAALNEGTHRLSPHPTSGFHDQGVRPIVAVRTRLGRTLRCTLTHPILTPDGWRAIGDLHIGARIASPRALPYFGNEVMDPCAVKLIAYALSDGSAQSSIGVTNMQPEVAEDLAVIAARYGMTLRRYEKAHHRAVQFRFVLPLGVRGEARQRLAASLRQVRQERGLSWMGWARAAGVPHSKMRGWYSAAAVPSRSELGQLDEAAGVSVSALAVEACDEAQMTTPVARLLEEAGLRHKTAAVKSVPPAVFRLPRQQMQLFLRTLFTCDGSVYVNRDGLAGVSYSTISHRLAEDVQHLLLRFGFVAKLRTKPMRVAGKPYTAYELQMLGVGPVKRFLCEIGIAGRDGAKALLEQRQALATAYPSPLMERLACGDVYWDEITSIEPAGEEPVYDLTVPGAANFVAGDLIVHNSTLLSQVAGNLAARGGKTLYVSGEESATQIKLRASRLGITSGDLLLYNETDVMLIAAAAQSEKPAFIIVDSIQTMQHSEIESAPGSVSQVRAATAALAHLAKGNGIPIFLVGHVTKEGSLAGPRVLEHMVDTVLTFEGDRHYAYRVLRAVKNRFGSTDEIGLFEMHEEGLVEVPNPSEMLLSERTHNIAGSAVTACVEGTRPLLIEVQALVAPSYLTNPRRTVSGVDTNRVNLILAVLEKRVGMSLANQDVFVNIAGGIRVDEPAVDLAIALAVASNFQEVAVDPGIVLAGEIGLGGEVRAVGQIEQRLREAARMGFTKAIVCAKNKAHLRGASPGLTVIGVENVRQALDAALVRR